MCTVAFSHLWRQIAKNIQLYLKLRLCLHRRGQGRVSSHFSGHGWVWLTAVYQSHQPKRKAFEKLKIHARESQPGGGQLRWWSYTTGGSTCMSGSPSRHLQTESGLQRWPRVTTLYTQRVGARTAAGVPFIEIEANNVSGVVVRQPGETFHPPTPSGWP